MKKKKHINYDEVDREQIIYEVKALHTKARLWQKDRVKYRKLIRELCKICGVKKKKVIADNKIRNGNGDMLTIYQTLYTFPSGKKVLINDNYGIDRK